MAASLALERAAEPRVLSEARLIGPLVPDGTQPAARPVRPAQRRPAVLLRGASPRRAPELALAQAADSPQRERRPEPLRKPAASVAERRLRRKPAQLFRRAPQ